jgi:hypothetical protein
LRSRPAYYYYAALPDFLLHRFSGVKSPILSEPNYTPRRVTTLTIDCLQQIFPSLPSEPRQVTTPSIRICSSTPRHLVNINPTLIGPLAQ